MVPGLMMIFPLESEDLELLAQGHVSLDISLYAPQDLVFVSALPLSRKCSIYTLPKNDNWTSQHIVPPIQGLSISEIQNLAKQNKRFWSKPEGRGKGSSGGWGSRLEMGSQEKRKKNNRKSVSKGKICLVGWMNKRKCTKFPQWGKGAIFLMLAAS